MSVYRIGGRSAATLGTANHAAAQIWNPHVSVRLKVTEMHVAITTAGVANLGLLRTTVRGTPGSTVTPAIQSASDRELAPPSGFLLDLALFAVQPTLDSPTAYLERWNLPAAVGAGLILPFPEGIVIPPGAGLAVVTPTAVVFPASDFSFAVEDP